MKTKFLILIVGLVLFNCTKNGQVLSQKITDDYEIVKATNSNKLLILFPGGGTTSKETKEEFNILEPAIKNGVSVLYMNFNRHLWIGNNDCITILNQITTAVKTNNLNIDNVYIGGMSIGGNVALTLSNYLLETNNKIMPKGVFVIDSPIDLYALYQSSKLDLQRTDLSEQRLAEPKWIVNYFKSNFGKDSVLTNIQKFSSYTNKTGDFKNISKIKNIKLNIYTEPDSLWWKQNRQTSFKSTNAYALQQMFKNLKQNNWDNINLIETKNKGYRLNGERHPHSWSIVDVPELLKWMKD